MLLSDRVRATGLPPAATAAASATGGVGGTGGAVDEGADADADDRAVLGLIKLLFAHGADVQRANNDGRVPLHYACRKGRLRSARWLASRPGADMYTTGRYGLTCAHHAALDRRLSVLRWLCGRSAGADGGGGADSGDDKEGEGAARRVWFSTTDLRRKDRNGKTAIDLCEQQGHATCAAFLRLVLAGNGGEDERNGTDAAAPKAAAKHAPPPAAAAGAAKTKKRQSWTTGIVDGAAKMSPLKILGGSAPPAVTAAGVETAERKAPDDVWD